MASDLKSLLTPELFTLVAESWIPLGKKEKVDDFGQVIRDIFFSSSSEDGAFALRPKLWPILLSISQLGLDGCPDWMDFLPPVESPEFPSQALALQLILDQAPRLWLKGVDARWAYGYFDEISIKYALALQDLPPHLRPSSWCRWEGSVTFEYWVVLRMLFGAPIVHHEMTSDAAVAFTDETRSTIEQRFNVRDPIRDQPERRWNMFGFPRLLASGGPDGPCDVIRGGFWIQELMDTHKPPLDKFGRYPYRNWVLGRDMTPEEEDWIREADFFKPPPEDVRKKIKEDVEKGVWSPIGDGVEEAS